MPSKVPDGIHFNGFKRLGEEGKDLKDYKDAKDAKKDPFGSLASCSPWGP